MMKDIGELSVGSKVTGEVIKVGDKVVTVSVNGVKGIIPISELSSLHIEKASDVIKEGDILNLKIIKSEDDDLVLSKKEIDAEIAWEELAKKFNNGETFNVLIKDSVSGGLVVDLGIRGFIPTSLLEKHFVEDFSNYVGKELEVKIVELDKENNRLILSHRAVIEDKISKEKSEIINSFKEGDVKEGIIQRITTFGVFVDIGGIDGLIHISQLSYDHVKNPSDIVESGQKVKVKILSINKEEKRISLSMKATFKDPWENINEKFKEGNIVTGIIKRIVPFGAFVEILPNVEGLVHVSQISHKHIKSPQEVLSEGQEVKVKILNINNVEKRISLSIKATIEDEGVAKEEDIKKYRLKEESHSFNLGEILGDRLRKLDK